MLNEGRLIIISGPTASGKSTLWRRLVLGPQAKFSVSATTRSRRDGEKDGLDYYFVSPEEFKEKISKGEFLEWARVHGNYYGTLHNEIEDIVSEGYDVVLEVDVQGHSQILKSRFKQISLFINPPSREILINRLRSRGTESEDQIKKRLEIVEQEMALSEQYDHRLVNDDFETMFREVQKILGYTSNYHG